MRPNVRIGLPEGEQSVVLDDNDDVLGEVVDEETRDLVIRACTAADASTERVHKLCDRLEASTSPANTAEVAKA